MIETGETWSPGKMSLQRFSLITPCWVSAEQTVSVSCGSLAPVVLCRHLKSGAKDTRVPKAVDSCRNCQTLCRLLSLFPTQILFRALVCCLCFCLPLLEDVTRFLICFLLYFP